MEGIYAVVKRYVTEDMDFCDWNYKPNDFDGIYGRVYLITGDHEISQEAADWAQTAKEGEIYEFREGEIEIQYID